MKKLIKLVLVLAVLLIVGAVAAYFYMDVIAKTAVERGGTYAFDVKTTVHSADLQIFGGRLDLHQLNVANPKDFGSKHFLDLKSSRMQVTLNSLRQDVVHVPLLRLTGVDVNLEKKAGGANYAVILENLKRLQGDPNAEGKRFIIDKLVIRNVAVHADLLGALGAPAVGGMTNVTVPIDEIKIKDIGAEGGRGVTMGELWGIVLKTVLASAVEKGGGLIPADIEGELRGKLKELTNLDHFMKDIDLGDLQKKAGELGLPQDAVDDAKKEIEKGIGDILGGDKKEP